MLPFTKFISPVFYFCKFAIKSHKILSLSYKFSFYGRIWICLRLKVFVKCLLTPIQNSEGERNKHRRTFHPDCCFFLLVLVLQYASLNLKILFAKINVPVCFRTSQAFFVFSPFLWRQAGKNREFNIQLSGLPTYRKVSSSERKKSFSMFL